MSAELAILLLLLVALGVAGLVINRNERRKAERHRLRMATPQQRDINLLILNRRER